jgi:hypothetical protein
VAEKREAGRGIVLDITEEIINVAVPKDSGHCVFADALRVAVPRAQFISVDLQTIRYSDPKTDRRYIYLTPAPIQRALVDFDQGIKPGPHKVRLGRPAQIMKMNTKRARKTAADKQMPEGTKRKLAEPKPRGKHSEEFDTVPTVQGGKYPPTAALSSARGRPGHVRSFGLRSLKP